jgi:ribosomal protein L29
MKTLKTEELSKMSETERKDKLKDLRIELIKSRVSSSKTSKTKDIKRAIARLLTFVNAEKTRRRQQ